MDTEAVPGLRALGDMGEKMNELSMTQYFWVLVTMGATVLLAGGWIVMMIVEDVQSWRKGREE